jgi:monofunctional chorismate mutase
MEASVGPQCGGPDWTPITPITGSLFHAETHGLPPSDPGREAEQVSRLRQLAAVSKLDPDFAEKFLAFVIREVIRHHESIPRGGATQDYMIER